MKKKHKKCKCQDKDGGIDFSKKCPIHDIPSEKECDAQIFGKHFHTIDCKTKIN